MITFETFEKIRQFIYRNGDLLTRKRFAYHFEKGSKQAVVDVLACYQNDDGGFGNGLELDMMCPASSGICMEMAFQYLLELGVYEGPVFDRAMDWILANLRKNDRLHHPVKEIKAYPHGEWWENDDERTLSIAGMLGKMGKEHPEINTKAAAVFEESHIPLPGELGVYSYPVALYLWYANGSDKYPEYREKLEGAFRKMLEKEAWHHPLFFCHNRWDSGEIPDSLWQSEAERAIATIQEDGGVLIDRYGELPWWRPVWTLDMLVTMKDKGLLK